MISTELVFEDEEVGGYLAKVAELPGCFTQGETIEEIRITIVDAIACHLKDSEDRPDHLAATLSVQV